MLHARGILKSGPSSPRVGSDRARNGSLSGIWEGSQAPFKVGKDPSKVKTIHYLPFSLAKSRVEFSRGYINVEGYCNVCCVLCPIFIVLNSRSVNINNYNPHKQSSLWSSTMCKSYVNSL